MFQNPSVNLTPSDFCLWGCVKSEVYKRKVDTRAELLARILDAVKINSDEQHAIFRREMKAALRLTVEFSNIYCEL